jgi:dTDP-4-amino-4,6-dideoxygalactose transaminase
MNQKFLPFSRPVMNQEAIDEVVACLKSGWLATGPRVVRFEEKLREYFKAPQAVTMVNATLGIYLSLQAMGIQEGDEVITTPMTFVASVNPIVNLGAKPVFVDVDLKTRNINFDLVEKVITPRTKAILPVHFAGVPVDLEACYQLAKKYNLRVLEDAAHSVGSFYRDKIIGSFGDVQVFSFHPNKVMTTGEGGCVTTRDQKLARYLEVARFHGIDRSVWNRYSKEGSQHYDIIHPGTKANMSDLQASIGIHQLNYLNQYIEHRQKLVDRYQKAFAKWSSLSLPEIPNYAGKISWYIYAPLIEEEKCKMNRDQFMQKMKEQNIGTGYHHHAVHLYTFYQEKFGYQKGQFPNAEKVSDSIVSLPLFSDMTFAEQDRVIETMAQILGEK